MFYLVFRAGGERAEGTKVRLRRDKEPTPRRCAQTVTAKVPRAGRPLSPSIVLELSRAPKTVREFPGLFCLTPVSKRVGSRFFAGRDLRPENGAQGGRGKAPSAPKQLGRGCTRSWRAVEGSLRA